VPKAKPKVIRLPIILRELQVAAVEDLTPTLRRITFEGPQLKAFEKDGRHLPAFRSEGPDDHVKILLPDPKTGKLFLPTQAEGVLDWSGEGRPVGRSYTPRGWHAGDETLKIDFVLHGHGTAGNWAAAAQPGQTIHIAGPKSSLLVPEADWFLLAGDETALPAIANWLESLPKDARVTAIIQIAANANRLALDAPEGANIIWIEDPELKAKTLVDAVSKLAWPEGEGFVWAAAERDAVRALRKHLIEERGHDKAAMDVVAYWNKGVSDEVRTAAHDRLHQLADIVAPHALRVATTLRLFDLVAEGKTDVPSLVAATGADRMGLTLLVPVLLQYGLLEGSTEALRLGVIGQMLRSDQHDFDHYDLNGANGRMDLAWGNLLQAVEGKGIAYELMFGQPFYDDMQADPELGASFDEELGEWSEYWANPVAGLIEVASGSHVSDVGGGTGVLLAAILARNPEARGTLVELPTAIEGAGPILAGKGVGERVALASQSFFEPLPPAPIQVLSQVLHNWPDAEAKRILSRCADAAGADGSVYVVERWHDPEQGHANAKSSLQMFLLFGARERTEAEIAGLAAEAGLQLQSRRIAGPNLAVYHFTRSAAQAAHD